MYVLLQYKDKLKTYVISSGMVYGGEEDALEIFFMMAWNNEANLPIFGSGENIVPLIHIQDLIRFLKSFFHHFLRNKMLSLVNSI